MRTTCFICSRESYDFEHQPGVSTGCSDSRHITCLWYHVVRSQAFMQTSCLGGVNPAVRYEMASYNSFVVQWVSYLVLPLVILIAAQPL